MVTPISAPPSGGGTPTSVDRRFSRPASEAGEPCDKEDVKMVVAQALKTRTSTRKGSAKSRSREVVLDPGHFDDEDGGAQFMDAIKDRSNAPIEGQEINLDDMLKGVEKCPRRSSTGLNRSGLGLKSIVRRMSRASEGSRFSEDASDPGEDVSLRPCGMLPGWVVRPDSKFYQRWYMWTIILVAYSAVVTPLRFAFFTVFKEPETDPPGPDDIEALHRESTILEDMDYGIDGMFLIDMMITSRLAFYDDLNGVLVMKPLTILSSYVGSFKFLMDIMATVPFDLFYELITGEHNIRVGYLGLARLVRLNRLFVLFNNMEASTRYNYRQTRLFKFMCIILGVGHWAGCLMWFLAASDSFKDGTWVTTNAPDLVTAPFQSQYVRSVYWAVTTLTTVGYGDLSPGDNDQELIVTILYMIFNMALSAYLLGNMTVLLTSADQSVADFRAEMTTLERFMARNNLPQDLRHQMSGQLQLRHKARDNQDEILDDMPPAIRTRVIRHIYVHSGSDSLLPYLFRGVTPNFRDKVMCAMRSQHATAGSWVVRQNDVPDSLFFLTSGRAAVMVTDDATHEAPGSFTAIAEVVVREGAPPPAPSGDDPDAHRPSPADHRRFVPLGEQAFLTGVKHLTGLKTMEECSMLALPREAWDELSAQYPGDVRHFIRNALEHTKIQVLQTGQLLGELREKERHLVMKERLQEREITGTATPRAGTATPRADAAGGARDFGTTRGGAGNGNDTLAAFKARAEKRASLAHKVLKLKELGAELLQIYVDRLEEAIDKMNEQASEQILLHVRKGSVRDLKLLAMISGRGEMDFNVVDGEGRSALLIAASAGRASVVSFLLERGVLPTTIDPQGRSPLLAACREGHDEVVGVLREQHAHLGMRTGKPTQEGCAQHLHAKAMVGGLGKSPAARQTAKNALIAVHAGEEAVAAAGRGEEKYLRRLLECGLDPDEVDRAGRTALIEAAWEGKLSVVRLLLEHDADPNIPDLVGRTALSEAVTSGHRETCKLLHDAGADLGFRMLNSATRTLAIAPAMRGKGGRPDRAPKMAVELEDAVAEGNEPYLRRLLDFGADPNAQDYEGRTPLHLCCVLGRLNLAIALVQAGGKVEVRDRHGVTPLEDAEAGGHGNYGAVLREVQAFAARSSPPPPAPAGPSATGADEGPASPAGPAGPAATGADKGPASPVCPAATGADEGFSPAPAPVPIPITTAAGPRPRQPRGLDDLWS